MHCDRLCWEWLWDRAPAPTHYTKRRGLMGYVSLVRRNQVDNEHMYVCRLSCQCLGYSRATLMGNVNLLGRTWCGASSPSGSGIHASHPLDPPCHRTPAATNTSTSSLLWGRDWAGVVDAAGAAMPDWQVGTDAAYTYPHVVFHNEEQAATTPQRVPHGQKTDHRTPKYVTAQCK
jgi:hypothetical protein